MSKPAFIAADNRDVLERHGLDNFAALWNLKLKPVDEPNTGRGGWSSVYRLELDDANGHTRAFYLKRQQNYLGHSVYRPLGEPTFAREFRTIQSFARKGVPALEPAFYEQRRGHEGWQAILLTRALDNYRPLSDWFLGWRRLSREERRTLVLASAALVRALHNSGIIHNCLYPKHIFLKLDGDRAGARLIDLEKARYSLGLRDRSRDLETLHRRSELPSRSERLRFMLAYFGKEQVDAEVRRLIRLILLRHRKKSVK